MKDLTIGRGSHCDIIVPDPSVSREHARLSIIDGKYVYEDIGKHGSMVNGQYVHAQKVVVAPGTQILLAGKVPLPWGQIYNMLPYKGTVVDPGSNNHSYSSDEGIDIPLAIVSFLIPIAGWVMYFVWKDKYPRKAKQAGTIACILPALGFIGAII